MSAVHPDKTAFRAVDVCGGVYTPEQEASGYAQGHRDALEDALKAVAPVDALMAEMLEACEAFMAWWEDRDGTPPRFDEKVRAAIAKAVSQ